MWEAVHEQLGRRLAVKVLHPRLSDRGEVLARFKREAETTARLGHPNIVQVTDFQWKVGEPAWLVMELLSGESLADCLAREGALPWPRVARIARQVLEGLAVAHEAGVVHRDLKPANIFLTQTDSLPDFVKIVDFGVARLEGDTGPRLTATGASIGTPLYMSPEQVRGTRADARADLWAVGVTLYEMLTGQPPFNGNDYAQLIAAILTSTPAPMSTVRPDVPQALSAAIESALERDLDRRAPTARAMLARLRGLDVVDAVPAQQSSPTAFAATAPGAPRPVTAAATPSTPAPGQNAWNLGGGRSGFDTPALSNFPTPAETEGGHQRRRGGSSLAWLVPGAVLLLAAAGVAAWRLTAAPTDVEEPDRAEREVAELAPTEPDTRPGDPGPGPEAPPSPAATHAAPVAPGAPSTVEPRAESGQRPTSPTAPREPSPEPARASPAEPEPAVATPEPAPEPEPEPEPVAEPEPEPPAPAPRATASRARRGAVRGSYDSWQAEAHLDAAHPAFERCIRERGVATGTGTFRITIRRDSRVDGVMEGPADARACLAQAVRRVAWTEPTSGAAVRVTYTLEE